MKVVIELVLNHTSDQHIWFQRARKEGPNSRWGKFYVWSKTPDKYQEARIILKISNHPTGPETRYPAIITGIVSIRISPI